MHFLSILPPLPGIIPVQVRRLIDVLSQDQILGSLSIIDEGLPDEQHRELTSAAEAIAGEAPTIVSLHRLYVL